jgi:hypothetical protein
MLHQIHVCFIAAMLIESHATTRLAASLDILKAILRIDQKLHYVI